MNMQQRISNKIQLGNTLNPALDYSGVPAIDDEANLESIYGKIDKIGGFWKSGKADECLARYIPNLLPVTRQNQVTGTNPTKAFASVTYLDKKNLEFIIELEANTYSNYSSMELVLPIQITKNTTKKDQFDGDMITVNNFLARWITDIDIWWYPDDTRILQTNNNVDVCQFAASQLKYLPKDSVKIIQKQLFYCNKAVYLAEGTDRRPNNYDDVNKCTKDNIEDRITGFKDLIFKKKNLHPFRYFSGSWLFLWKPIQNFYLLCKEIWIKFLNQEKNLQQFLMNLNALIQFHDRPYIA